MNHFILLLAITLFSTQAYSQNSKSKTQIEIADELFEEGAYQAAKEIYIKYAYRYKSSDELYKAALCEEFLTGKNPCETIKEAQTKGFKLTNEQILFYGCDPKTFERIKP